MTMHTQIEGSLRPRSFLIIKLSLILGGIAWLLLFITSHGVLIKSKTYMASSNAASEVLVCTYFIGTSTDSVEFWRSIRSTCPRLYNYSL